MEKEGLNFKLSEKKILIYVENPGESSEKPLWLVGEFSKGGAKLIYQSQSFMVTCNNWMEKIIEGLRMNHFFPSMLVSLIIILFPGSFLWLKCYLLTYLAVPWLLPQGVPDALSDSAQCHHLLEALPDPVFWYPFSLLWPSFQHRIHIVLTTLCHNWFLAASPIWLCASWKKDLMCITYV